MAATAVGFNINRASFLLKEQDIPTLRMCVAMTKRDPYLTAWEAYNLRRMEFDLRRLEFGQAFGQQMNAQNGKMDNVQGHISTQAEIDLWLFKLGRKMGLLCIKHNEQGLALWAYYSQSHDLNAYQPVPDGA